VERILIANFADDVDVDRGWRSGQFAVVLTMMCLE
jgi:hypothetical protein